jgi:uncharacterized membrane protein YqiK
VVVAVLVAGVVWFHISWLVSRADDTSLTTGGSRRRGPPGLSDRRGRTGRVVAGGWHIALALLLALGAVWAFVRPVNTFFALASSSGCCS